jgi:hypothetical protein
MNAARSTSFGTDRRILRPRCWAWILALCASTLSAQTEPAAPSQAARVGAAWLKEVLDLDTAAAAHDYRRLLDDAKAPPGERLVATARLLEIERLGALPQGLGPILGTTLAPEPLQQAASRQRDQDQEQGLPTPLATPVAATGAMPALRPFVGGALPANNEPQAHWTPDRMRTARDRMPGPSASGARLFERIRALAITRHELDGDRDEAEALRKQHFPDWRPMPWTEEPREALALVRRNLTAWRNERQLSYSERDTLRRLDGRIAQALATDAQQAIDLLDRLPYYAERLRQANATTLGERAR